MITLSCLLFSFVCLAHSQNTGNSNFCSSRQNGNYPDPDNCYKYIICWQSITYSLDCPSGYAFDERMRSCQLSQNVPCAQETGFSCAGKANGNYPDQDNCYKYITCWHSITYLFDCPSGYAFDERTGSCQLSQNVPCAQETGFSCSGKADGNYPDPDNCYKHFTCLNSIMYTFDCPSGYAFDERTGSCQLSQNVHCGQETGFSCSGKADGNYPDPDNCYKHFTCLNSIMYTFDCPSGYAFDERTGSCQLSQNVQCGQGTSVGTGCQEGSTSLDNCGQRCTCVGGQLVNCVRIRKEFTSMTDDEKKRHIDTILKVSALGSNNREEYEQLINEHFDLFDSLIHERQYFIPWHRYFILQYENLMRKEDCTFTAAYWDWSLDSREPFSTGPENVWNSDTGFGGDGDEADQNCVLDGPFSKDAWNRVRPNNPRDPLPDCLTRDFSGDPPEEVDVTRILSIDDFTRFEFALRDELHDTVHCQIRGTMCSHESASAPEFFLHHGFIDKIWDDWQKKSTAHKYVYFPMIQGNMPGTDLRPAQLIDLSNQPGGVSVEYEPYEPEERIRSRLLGLSPSQLQHKQRRPFTGLSSQAIRLFQISTPELKKIRELEKWLDPNVIEPEQQY